MKSKTPTFARLNEALKQLNVSDVHRRKLVKFAQENDGVCMFYTVANIVDMVSGNLSPNVVMGEAIINRNARFQVRY